MLRHSLLWLLPLLSMLAPAAWSAEISVPPGNGTLAAAVATANAGDTLVLRDGSFSGDVTVDKSLILRPVNRGTFAVMVGTLRAEGEGIRVTVQGLRFTQNLLINRAAAVRVLENDFAAGSIIWSGPVGAGGAEPDAFPALVIVGNQLASGSIVESGDTGSGASYIAGNTLVSGSISSASSAWIVGNKVRPYGGTCIAVDGPYAAWVRILANHLQCYGVIIWVNTPYTLLADNVVEVINGAGVSNAGAILTDGPGYSVIMNNVIRLMSTTRDISYYAIRSDSPVSRVSGNIILNWLNWTNYSPFAVNGAGTGSADISNNLCFGGTDCPSGNGNLNADPRFVDLIDYRLAPNSPAINAGPTDYSFADLDRTRNDMGAYGGPWSIGQYDAQRDPNNLTPYVYPMNAAGWGVSGSVEVQALGVARLR